MTESFPETVKVPESERHKRVILEVGSGGDNYFRQLAVSVINPSDIYIPLDLIFERAQKSKNSAEAALPRRVEAVQADSQLLPFADASIDELVLPDVLNAPVVNYGKEGLDRDKINNIAWGITETQLKEAKRFPDFERQQTFLLLDNILLEVKRVLKPNGRVLIVDAIGPAHQDVYGYLIQKLYKDPDYEFTRRHDLEGNVALIHSLKSEIYQLIKKPPQG